MSPETKFRYMPMNKQELGLQCPGVLLVFLGTPWRDGMENPAGRRPLHSYKLPLGGIVVEVPLIFGSVRVKVVNRGERDIVAVLSDPESIGGDSWWSRSETGPIHPKRRRSFSDIVVGTKGEGLTLPRTLQVTVSDPNKPSSPNLGSFGLKLVPEHPTQPTEDERLEKHKGV